jgi:hypothetical protein
MPAGTVREGIGSRRRIGLRNAEHPLRRRPVDAFDLARKPFRLRQSCHVSTHSSGEQDARSRQADPGIDP